MERNLYRGCYMNRKLLRTIILVIIILFIGYRYEVVKNSISQAKVLLESKDYDEAMSSLQKALDKNKENKEAKKMYKIVDLYKQAESRLEKNNFEEANGILSLIDKDYIKYPIKDDIDLMKRKVDNYYNQIEKINTNLIEAQKLFNNKEYKQCIVYLLNNILGSEEDGIEENKYANEEQRQKAYQLVERCEKNIGV